VPGVWKVHVDFDNQEARVTYDAKRASVELMSAALQSEGYQGSLKSEPVPGPGG
jgi:copper chaperone CopZ